MTKKRLTRSEANTALRSKQAWEALRRMPDDVDAKLAARVVLEVLDHRATGYRAVMQAMPLPVVREVLARLVREETRSAVRLFLREALQAGELHAAWRAATTALLELDTAGSWGSQPLRAAFKGLARHPVMLAAMQTAVVGAAEPPVEMLAVLAADGGDASIDALLPVFARGQADELLARLTPHAAKTAAMQAMLAQVATRRGEKERASPAVAFARDVLGFEVTKVAFSMRFSSTELSGSVPRYQGSLSIDSTQDAWWAVSLIRLHEMDETSFGARASKRDALKVGTCASLEQLPAWVRAAGKKLRVEWELSEPYGSLRGKKRAQVREWLASPPSA